MWRKITLITMVFALVALTSSLSVYAEAPNFSGVIYGDGELWGTKGLRDLPPPNGHNDQSFDKLFTFVEPVPGQLPVAEAAPGNRHYNGGRWNVQLVMWTIQNPPIVTSYDEIQMHADLDELVIRSGNRYFECPLLPVKE
jgi:hypothetical protein